MKFYNVMDDQNRFCGLKIEITEKSGQYDTHGFSYLYMRNMYKEMDDKMGLDYETKQKNNSEIS